MPDDKATDLLQTIADLRREAAQYKAERDEALEQQTATAEVLQVINSSPGNLAPVFDAMLDKALRLCEAAFGVLWTFEGELGHAATLRGVPPAFAEFLTRGPHRESSDTGNSRLRRGEPVLQIADIADDDAYRSGDPVRRALVELGGGRTMLAVPLRKDDALLGSFIIYRQEVRPFTDKQIALLENFAAQAVIAMQNARLITETREALEQQTATAEVLGVINSSPGDLQPVFDAILEKAHSLCGAAFGSLLLYDGVYLRAAATRGLPEALADLLRQPFSPEPNGPAERLLAGDRFYQIADQAELLRRPSSPNPRRSASFELAGVRTVLFVPLRREDALLGIITVYRREARPFTGQQIALLENFAAQAVVAMENARLIAETQEALEQQTATAEVLQVINSSPGDLTPVFDAMLEKAMRLCGAGFGVLSTYDGETFRTVVTRGVPAPYAEYRAHSPPAYGPGTGPARLLGGERVVHNVDLMDEDAYRTGEPNRRALVDLGGARTSLQVALLKDEAVRGMINIYRQEVRPFSDKQIALLENFAAQAVIAMENARLITETREALEQQTATAEVLGVINSSPGDLAPVFDAMLEKTLRLCEAAHGNFLTYDGEVFHQAAFRGEPQFAEYRRQQGPLRPAEIGQLARVVQGGGTLHRIDAREDEAYRDDPAFRQHVDGLGIRTSLTVPLRKGDALLGAVRAYRREVRPFTDKQIALVENFAAQAVIAMENARLLTETREALEQQTATAEVLQVINASPGDLAPVFNAMLDKAMRLCGADFGIMLTVDGAASRIVAERDVPETLSDFLAQHPPDIGPDTFFGRAVLGRSVLHTADMSGEAVYRGGQPLTLTAVDLAGVRALLMAPLLKDDGVSGVFAIFRREARPFTDKQIALLQNFAAQAVIAMENARLITETREALEQQTATAEVLGVINSSPGDLAPVFDAMLEKARTLCDAATGALFIYEGEHFRAVAMQGGTPAWHDRMRVGFRGSETPASAPLLAGESFVHIADMAQIDHPTARAAVEAVGVRTFLSVPLRKDDALCGMIVASRPEVRPFTDKQIALLQNFAAQAVIAMENARLLGELRARTDEIAGWNRELEERVATQLAEIERTGKLRRFLAPQLADLILAQGDESILESHRREIVVVFCDLRGFTGFAERAEPEEVMALLRDYHAAMGPIVAQFEGTIDHYGGDGIMVFFNDPLPTPDPVRRAIDMAVAMRETAQPLLRTWRRKGHDIGFGVGISQGYATLGQIGFAERMDYTAIGTVTNLAARLCAEAKDGQILVSAPVAIAVEDSATLEEIGDLSLKGLSQAVAVYNVVQ